MKTKSKKQETVKQPKGFKLVDDFLSKEDRVQGRKENVPHKEINKMKQQKILRDSTNPSWKAFMDLRKQAQRSAAAGMSEMSL
ncbi:MAG: hypothetical protein SPL52_00210 [Fibrobacter sp.]|nr:hypothetical protein [Fibrobacter sp.]